MKKIIIILLLFTSDLTYAQNTAELVTLLNQLREMPLFKECRQFKSQIESQTKEASKNTNTTKQIKDLETSYTTTWQKYDFFLKTVKQDLIDTQRLNLTSDQSSSQYLALLNDVKEEYDTNFLPVYQSISGGKDIPEEVLRIGIELVKNIVQKIKTRKIEKKEALNSILPQLNKYLYDNLRLKTFSELDIYNSATIKPSVIEPVNVPAATINSMEGAIQFVQLLNNEEIPMEFEQNSGKDITVDTESGATYKTPYFTTLNNYPIGSKFQIKADADVFIYALVLNSDGVKILHPNIEYNQQGKDIDVVIDSTPTIGQFILPQKGAFSIVPTKDGRVNNSEDFALIISKSELIMEETIEKLNVAQGQLDERFSQVFSNQQITLEEAQVQLSGSQLSFLYNKADKNILPLVFKVLR